jgi:hypothetical protein
LGDDLAQLVRRHVDEATESLRRELERLRDDVVEHARDAGGGAAYLGAAAGLALLATGAIAFIPLLALRRIMSPTAIALTVAAGGAAGAAVAARAGFARVKRALPDEVRERVEQAESDVADALKARATNVAPPRA